MTYKLIDRQYWSTGATCARDEETNKYEKETLLRQTMYIRSDHQRRRIEIIFCMG